MKQSIGTVWITGLVITFMLIFTGYLAVTISYSASVKEKNYILSIIEKKNGITSMKGKSVKSVLRNNKKVYTGFGTLESINLFLRGNAYKQTGTCGESVGDGGAKLKWYGVKDLYADKKAVNGGDVKVKVEEITNSNKNKKYYYCFAKIVVDNSRKGTRNAPAAYYRVRLFYSLELPIVNSLVFTIDGKTDVVEIPSRCEIRKLRANGVKCTAGNVKNT